MFSLVRKWVSHLIHKHGQKFVKEVPVELLQFSLSSCSVELQRLDLQERLFENLEVLLPFQVGESYLEDVAVSLRWRGSSCTIVVEARQLVVKAKMRPYKDWEQLLRDEAPELQSREAAQKFKVATLVAHEEEVLDLARRLLGTAAIDQSGSMPDLEFKLGGAAHSTDGVDQGFQLILEEDSGQISLTGSGLEIRDGVNLNEILNPSQAWHLDFRLLELTASCEVDGRSAACIGPCEELGLEFTFAQQRKVKGRKELPDWSRPRAMAKTFEEMEELPTVSLAVTSTSCPVRASIAQVAFFTSHGLCWSRWFAFREALASRLSQTESDEMESDENGVNLHSGPGSCYRRGWLQRLPRLLDASPAEVRSGDAEVEKPSCEDPSLAGFEAKHQVRETLRERRLALLNPGNVVEENGGLVLASQQCICSETRTSYETLLSDPTARHTFALMVNITCSEVELQSETSSLAVLPTSLESRIVVDLGVHDAPDLKPLSLNLALSDCELRRRPLSVTTQRDSTLSQRSSNSSSQGSSTVATWGKAMTFGEPPLLRVVGVATLVMDLQEPDDAEMADLRSPRWYLDIGGLLHACVSYPLVLDVLELVGQLQLELLEVTSQEEEILLERTTSDGSPKQRRSSLLFMPVTIDEDTLSEEDQFSALVGILGTIRAVNDEFSLPASSNPPGTDLRINALNAPLTLVVPCARSIDGAEDRVLGPTLEGLLVMQLRVQCEPTESPLLKADEFLDPSEGMLRTHPTKESHTVSSKLISAKQLSAWLLPEDPARHLLKTSFADVDLTQHQGRPILLACEKVTCRVSQEEELHFKIDMSEVMLHVSQYDVSLLSMLFRSLNTPSGAVRVDPEVDESDVNPTPKTSVELMAAGLSVRLLQNVQGREKVLVRLDIGTQELHLVQEEELQLLRYSLQHVLLSDRQQELILLRFFGEENNPCAKIRYTKQKCPETSLLLGHLQILAHWNLFSALVVYLMTLKSTVMALQGPRQSYAPPSPRRGTRRLSQAPPVQRKQGINGMVLRGRFQQILFYVPTFGEGLEEQGGLLLCCGFQVAGGPIERKGHWKGQAKVCQLSLMAVDSLEPSLARSGSSAILHPMRIQLTLTMKEAQSDYSEETRHTDFYGLRVLVEPVRVTLQPNHLKAVAVLQNNIDQLKAQMDTAPQAPTQVDHPSRSSTVAPVAASHPWTGHLKVSIPVLRVGAVALPEEPESCILVLEAVTADAMAAIGTAIGVETCSAAEQAAAAAAVAAASALASRSAKAAAKAATASAAAAAAAAATAKDAEESVTASDFCFRLQAQVGAVYCDVVSSTGPEEQEMPAMEPTMISLLVPAYQGLRTKRKVWNNKELLQAPCPRISISWVNIHASEVNAAVLSRLYSCFQVAKFAVQYKQPQGGFLLMQADEEQLEITRERTGKRVAQTLRNALGICAVLGVPEKSRDRSSRMIARLKDDMGLTLDVAKRRANKVLTRVSRTKGMKQQRIAKSRSALLDVPGEKKSPVRSMLPMIARANDLVAGAGRVAQGAVKDTVKRSGEVFKELRKAAAAEMVISREVDEADELERVVTKGLGFGEKDSQGNKENFGLAMLPGWPLADLKAAIRHRSRSCTVLNLPLLPAETWSFNRDSLRDSTRRNSRHSKTSDATEELPTEELPRSDSQTEAKLYDDDAETDLASEYSRSNSGWSEREHLDEDEDEVSAPGTPGSLLVPTVITPVKSPMRSSLRSAKSPRSSQASETSYRSPLSSFQLWRRNTKDSNQSSVYFGRQSGEWDIGNRAKRKLQTMNNSVKGMAGFASEVAAKTVDKVKNFAMQRKLKRGIRHMEFNSKVLVRKVANAGRKDLEGNCELEMSSTIFLQNRTSSPLVVFPLTDDAKGKIMEDDQVQQDDLIGMLQKCGWLVMQPKEAPQAVPLMWCVSERVFRAVDAAQQAAEELLFETENHPGGLSKLLDEDAQVWHEGIELKVTDAAQKGATLAFAESHLLKKPLRPWCCALSSLEEVGLDNLEHKAPDEVLPALKKLLLQGDLQPLLEDGTWNALIGAKKHWNKQEMIGRRLEQNLRGLCSTINGIGMSRPRSPQDSLFFLVTVEYMVRVCNRLCCTLELRPHEASGHGSAAKERVLPGEDAECPELDQMQLELLLPKEKVPHVPRGSLGTLASLAEEGELEDLEAGVEHEAGKESERYVLIAPAQLLDATAFNSTPTNRRYSANLSAGVMQRKGNTCVFKAPGDAKLVEVQVHREDGVVQEHCPWPDLHSTQFGSHTSQITLFVSHWLVNRATCSVIIPHPRLVTGLIGSRAGKEEPLMIVPASSLRPLSQHALQDGSLEIALRQGEEVAGSPSLLRTSTLRARRHMFAAQKHSKTGNIKVDRPGKSGVLPSLALGDQAAAGSLCMGFSVNQAPFPFYRTLVVELTRRYTLVNLKRHRLWVSDGSRALELPPNEPRAYHPNNSDAEFHLDISGVGPNAFTAGFRLSQLFNVADGGTSGRRGKLQLMYKVSDEDANRSSAISSGSLAFSGQTWGLIAVEAMEDSSALIIRFSDPAKPQFRMVNRARGSVAFRQDHASSPFFYLPAEGVLNFAWYSPPSFRSATENATNVLPALLLGAASDDVEAEEDLLRLELKRYDIAQVREHDHLEFPQDRGLRSTSRMSQAVSKRLTRMTRKSSWFPSLLPDIYKVRTTVHQGSLEIHIFPWVRVSNETTWQVTVRADSSDMGKRVNSDDWVDLWPRGSNRSEMLFQMKRCGEYAEGSSFEWSQPLTLSESMTTYRGFFRQRCGGEADTVEVSVSRDEVSGFLRLTLSNCKQEPFLIENKSSEKCRLAPKNATGWVMNLENGDGECPFFSHLWGGDTWMTLSIGRGEMTESFDFDLSIPATHNFRDLIIEVGKVKHHPRRIVVKDSTVKERRISRRSIRERGVFQTLNRMSVAFRHDHLEMGVKNVTSLMSTPGVFTSRLKTQVTFADAEEVNPEDRRYSTVSANVPNTSHATSLHSGNYKRDRFIEWVTMTSTLSTVISNLKPPRSRFRCCRKEKPPPQPVRRKKAVRMRPSKSKAEPWGDEQLDWALDLDVEGMGVAMLDMQLDTRESHELGYGSLKFLRVKLRQVAAKTDVEGRAGALSVELRLGSLHLDVGTGEARHHSKACHSVLRPFTGPLQILSQDGEPPPLLHLEALLKLVTENQEGGTNNSKAIDDTRDGSAHYEVRRLEMRVQPIGLHIETALVSEVVVWVLEMSSVLKTGTLRHQNAMQHLANALDAEAMNAEDALVDLRYCEPRVVQNPTAEDFKDQVPVVIRELTLRKICCVMTLSFTGTGTGSSERKEELQALEMLLRLTLPLDVHQARLILGKMTRGMSVKDFTVRERFLSNGSEELTEILVSQLKNAMLAQVPKLFGSQLLIGNPRRLGEELLRAAELGALGISSMKPQVVLAALLLGFAAFTTALRGIFLIASKESCRLSTGHVPDQLLREPPRVRETIAQALYYGLPWHCYRLSLRLSHRWGEWSQRCGPCEGLRLLLLAIFWIICMPISALLVTVTKILQTIELLWRRTARWASPTHVTAIGPPTPMRTGSQQFVAGYPKQFSRSAARPLAGLKSELAYVSRSDWILRELPTRSTQVEELQEDEENLWGWLLLLRSSAQLILVQPAPPLLPELRVELVEPPPEETRRIKGPFLRVELGGPDNTVLKCYSSMSRVEQLQLPCREAALIAFSLAAENVFRG